ncbi:MAG: hypothetical protein EOL92_00400 [Bacteroidia bacterium]|nr:hypothetical protein [Bacteroidia bacterium]
MADQGTYSIDCAAGNIAGGMRKAKIWRFPLFVRFLGSLIALPSAFGMVVGIVTAGSGGGSPESAVLSTAVGGGFFLFSAIGGLIGWLLLMRKKAWVCRRCGYVIDRA